MIGEPLFFERNRVGRVYTGGKLFTNMWGEVSEDDFFPEEWIASNVQALNKEKSSPKEGVSKIAGSDLFLDELINEYKYDILGSSGKMRILVKILDSAVRLPAQAHPDKEFSQKYFQSEYGKTECWIILDTRPDAKLYFGFKNTVDKKIFSAAIDESLTNKDVMANLMNYFIPKKNEIYFVPAKMIHAIGAGCLILEVQEPTDFTIQPEHWCADYKLNDQEMYLGLSKEVAIDCFDFHNVPDTKMNPITIFQQEGVTVENLIGPKITECFVINRIRLNNGKKYLDVFDSYGVYIVTDGQGTLIGPNYCKKIKKGDYFLMPSCLMGEFYISGKMECIECW